MSVLPQQYSSCASCLPVPQVAQHSPSNVIACATLLCFSSCFPSYVHFCRYLWWALSYLILSLLRLLCSCHLSPLAIHPCPLSFVPCLFICVLLFICCLWSRALTRLGNNKAKILFADLSGFHLSLAVPYP